MKIQLKHSNVLDTGAAKQPTAPNMLDGEIAVNFNATDPAIFIKNSDGNIVRIAGKDNLSFTGYETSIQAAATPPSGLVAGNLYFDTDDNRLYYYYDNGTTQQWVDASTEKFDVTIIPDPTNLNHQSGTLDDRYVNSNGDTMTGNLVLNAGVNLNSSDVYLNNGKVVFEGANANAHEIRLTVVEPTADRVISLPDVTGTLVSTGDSGTVTSGMIADGTIQNSDVSNSAAIGLSKLATGALPSGITVASTNIVNGTIVDADINSSAAIALTKLGTGALPSGITIASSGISGGVSPTDIAAGALPNNVTVVSANIVDGSIVNADISNTASIQVSKLADGNSYQLLQTNAAGNGVEWTSNIDVPGTLDVTGISTFDDNLTVAGNLAVTGSTVSLDANIVTVKDGNIQLGVVSTPTDVTADGGGITLKGSTDKTLSWINSTDAWTSSEHFNLATGKAYYVNGSEVLNGSSLGSSVTGSSLTGLGTISSGVWQGTQIVDTYLATITGTGKVANSATSATNLNSGNAIVSRDGSGDFTARNVTAALIGNASTASALENARTIALTGDLTGSASFDGSSNISISTTATFTGTTNLTYNSTTRKVESDTGTDATIPLFSNTVAGLAGASGGGTVNYLRADGSWASPPGTATNLGYTAATSTITSSTGTGVAIPNFSSTNAGFVQGSGGGTTKFLRADGNWIALGSSSTSIGTSPPSNPNAGDSWFDTDEGRTYIYYQDTDSSQWVESNPSWNGGIPTGSVTPGYLSTGGPNWDASGNLSATGSITAASGVISGSLTQGGNNVVTVGDTGTVTSTMILDGTIVNTDINSAAAIALNKLASGALPSAITIGSSNIVNGTIVDADISTSAAISLSKLSSGALPSNITVTSSNISDLSIVNTDVNASAAIAGTKISPDFGSQNVLTTGNVGIGVTPTSPLHVKHATFNTVALFESGDTQAEVTLKDNAGQAHVGCEGNALFFKTSSSGTERMRIDSSGKLLVGTASDYAENVQAAFYGASNGGIALASGTSGLSRLMFADATAGNAGAYVGSIIYSHADNSLRFNVNGGSERMRIDSSGRLLVGTTSARGVGHGTAGAFEIEGTSATVFASVVKNSADAYGGSIALGKSRGTAVGANTAVQSGDELGSIRFAGADGTDVQTRAAQITAAVDGTPGANDMPGRLVFSTTPSGSSSPSERLRISANGNIKASGQVQLSDGTAGSPGLTFFSDGGADTGIFRPGVNTLAFSTGGTERARIDSSGRVGIGTSSPSYKLAIHDTGVVRQEITCTDNDGAGAGVFLRTLNSGSQVSNATLRTDNAGNFQIFTGTTSDTEQLRIDSSGRVGIGITTFDDTATALVIKNSASGNDHTYLDMVCDTNETSRVRFSEDGSTFPGQIKYSTLSQQLSIDVNSAERMRIDDSGKVGIGTSSPAQLLHLTSTGSNAFLQFNDSGSGGSAAQARIGSNGNDLVVLNNTGSNTATERLRITSGGNFQITDPNNSTGLKSKISFVSESPYQDEVAYVGFQREATSGAPCSMVFATGTASGATERMRIDSSGNLFIGGTTAASADIALNANGTSTFGPINVSSSTGYGSSINIAANAGDIRSQCQQTASQFTQLYGAYMGSNVVWAVYANGSSTFTGTLSANGGISAATTTDPAIYARKNGTGGNIIQGRNAGGGEVFRVQQNGDTYNANNVFSALSDIKLKENIVDAKSQWDDIKALRPVNYNFKAETGQETHTQIGLVAQEVELVSPGLVSESPDRDDEGNDLGTVTKGVSYSVLYMKAVKALQEAMERIETLEQRLTDAGIA